MQVFDTGDEATTYGALRRFAREMDDLGEAYGCSGDDYFMPPYVVEPGEDATPHDADEPHAVVVIAGRGWIFGNGARVDIRTGQGAWWPAGERWDIGAVHGPMQYIEVDGPALRANHLSL